MSHSLTHSLSLCVRAFVCFPLVVPALRTATDGSIGHAEEPGSKWAGGEKVHPASLPYFIHFIFQVCSGRLASYDFAGKGGSTAKKTTIDLSKMDFNMLLPGRRECGCQGVVPYSFVPHPLHFVL